MSGTKLECAQVEKDLGVIVDQSLYLSIEYKSKEVILTLFTL